MIHLMDVLFLLGEKVKFLFLCSLSFVLLFTPVLCSANCNTVLDEQSALQEISKLIFQVEQLEGKESAAIKAILKVNIIKLVKDYESSFGVKFNLEEAQKKISLLRDEKHLHRNGAEEKKTRAKEKQGATVLTAVATYKLGEFSEFDASNIKGEIGRKHGSGIQWSDDSKFVILRPDDVKKSVLVNLETKSVLGHINAQTGLLSEKGHYYASEGKRDHTVVHDLDSGKKYGPFKGEYDGKHFNDEFIYLRHNGSEGDLRYLVHYKTGRILELDDGQFQFSDDLSQVARISANNSAIDVVDSISEKVIKSFPFTGEAQHQRLDYSPPGFFYLKVGKNWSLIRFSDFKKFPIFGFKHALRPDPSRTSIMVHTNGLAFQRLADGAIQKFGNVARSISDHQGRYTFLQHGLGKNILFDSQSFQAKELNYLYEAITDDGKILWATECLSPEDWVLHTYNTETGIEKSTKIGDFFDVNFIPHSDYVLLLDGTDELHLNDINFLEKDLKQLSFGGWHSASISPNGRYILTYDQQAKGSLSIYEVIQ